MTFNISQDRAHVRLTSLVLLLTASIPFVINKTYTVQVTITMHAKLVIAC